MKLGSFNFPYNSVVVPLDAPDAGFACTGLARGRPEQGRDSDSTARVWVLRKRDAHGRLWGFQRTGTLHDL